VGGDFYDFIFLADGRIGFVIGDVSDTGIPAALVMATTRAILRAVVTNQTSPGEILARTNDLLYPDIPQKMFVTCLCAIFNPTDGRLRYANAGHNPPFRRSAYGVEELCARGMPLGLMPEVSYEEHETTIGGGDQLLFYSDGLIEAHNPQREIFGSQRLRDLLASQSDPAGSATAFIDTLLAEWNLFIGPNGHQADDLTLVMLHHCESCEIPDKQNSKTEPQQAQFDKYG
jgi:serine phosphatase RsbU (regulator of sigma subunit)